MTDDRQRELIASALQYAGGRYTVDDVLTAVTSGQMQVWPGERSILVTEVYTYPHMKELFFFLGAGSLPEIRRLYHIVLAWGRKMGCTRAAFVGRPGWARSFLVKEEGWSAELMMFERAL